MSADFLSSVHSRIILVCHSCFASPRSLPRVDSSKQMCALNALTNNNQG